MKRLTIAIVLLSFAAACFAPIEDKPPGAEFHNELSQDELAKYQSGGTAHGNYLGESGMDGSAASQRDSEKDAAGILAQSAQDTANAKASLGVASKDLKEEKGHWGKFAFISILLILVGLCGAYGLRLYMDSKLPNPPPKRKLKY